ncbi:MAG TPA: hypothetical protein VMC85_19695 [Desulfomonilaceae bacterium]|nr:hypothetical protein [Desulfomonilaceae bacterium]
MGGRNRVGVDAYEETSPAYDKMTGLAKNQYYVRLLASLRNSCLPGLGFTTKMHYGNNEENFASDLVNNPIGKTVCTAASRPFRNQRPSFRILDDPFDCSPDVFRKFKAQALLFVIIIFDGIDELCPCGFKKFDIHLVLGPI